MKTKLKPKPKAKPKGKPKPKPKRRPIRETEAEPEVGVSDSEESGMKKESKLTNPPLTLEFVSAEKTITFTAIDQMKLAAVVEDFLTSNGIKFEKVVTGEEAPNEEEAEVDGEKKQEEADRESDLRSDR